VAQPDYQIPLGRPCLVAQRHTSDLEREVVSHYRTNPVGETNPCFAASYARRRSLEIGPVTFACRVAFFQDSMWFAGMWELTM